MIYGSSLFGVDEPVTSYPSHGAAMDGAPGPLGSTKDKTKRRHTVIRLEFAEELKRVLGRTRFAFLWIRRVDGWR